MTDICAGEVVNMIALVSVESIFEEQISTNCGIKKKKNVKIFDNTSSEMVELTI